MEFLRIEVIVYSNIKRGSQKYITDFFKCVDDLANDYLKLYGYLGEFKYIVQYYDPKLKFRESKQVPKYVCDLSPNKNILYISVDKNDKHYFNSQK